MSLPIGIDNMIKELSRKQCWGISAGPPNGSYIVLHFGERIKRNYPINNKNLLYGLDKDVGEYGLGIYCAWRIQKGGVPITGSSESNHQGGPLVEGLLNILNKSIDKIEIVDECGDLALDFDDVLLKIFCSNTGHENDDYCVQHESNWVLFHRGKAWIEVERGCKWVVHP